MLWPWPLVSLWSWQAAVTWLAYLVPMLLLVAWPSGPAKKPRPVAASPVIGQPARR